MSVTDGPERGDIPERDVPEADGEASRELRALYQRLQPPPLADDARAADPETARVVGWVQDAWRGLAVPPARVPLVPRRSAPLPRLLTLDPRTRRRTLVAAAAVLLLLAGAALWQGLAGAPPLVSVPRVADGSARPDAGGVEVLAALPDRLELRSGPVRLVLLEPPNEPSTTPTTDLPTGG